MNGLTFGFEAEFQTDVTPLAAALYDDRLTVNNCVHSYGCDCEGCEYDPCDGDPYPFRVKSDSSCGGEVISRICGSIDEARDLFQRLENNAVRTDSEPGMSAGFHVHVSREHLTPFTRGALVLAMTRWEPTLFDIASGRWSRHRGWNHSLFELLDWEYRQHLPELRHLSATEVLLGFPSMTTEPFVNLADTHRGIDRHSTMAFSPRYPTMEFRLWNSTRSAWRMELWCLLSMALADPLFAASLNVLWTSKEGDVSVTDFVDCLAEHDPGTVSELLARQVDYMRRDDRHNNALTMA